MVFSVDLSHVDRIMAEHYSKFGPAPRPASCMLRSMLLSTLHGTTSITKWVDTMRSLPLFAIISDFAPDDVPGVGTFYDFIARLWNSDSKNLSPHIHCKKPTVKKPAHKGDKADFIEKITANERLQNYILNPLDTKKILLKIDEVFTSNIPIHQFSKYFITHIIKIHTFTISLSTVYLSSNTATCK